MLQEKCKNLARSKNYLKNEVVLSHLTKREKEIAITILKYSNLKKVSLMLNISVATVRSHATNLRLKMDNKSTYIAAHLAQKEGWLD